MYCYENVKTSHRETIVAGHNLIKHWYTVHTEFLELNKMSNQL